MRNTTPAQLSDGTVAPWPAGMAPETVVVGKPGTRLHVKVAVDGTGRLHVIWGEARHIRDDPFHWDFAVRHRSREPQGWTATETFHETVGGRGPPPGGIVQLPGTVRMLHPRTGSHPRDTPRRRDPPPPRRDGS